MIQNPLVSVIIPTYNCSTYLRLAVRSAIEQSYENKEIIVVDDGSTDDTKEVLAEFGSAIAVISQSNSGIAAARNAGMRASRGALIAFLDSDDYWLPEKLSKQVTYLNDHPEVGAVFCTWREWRPTPVDEPAIPEDVLEASGIPGIEQGASGMLYNELLQDCVILTSTLLLRRTIMQEIGWFDPELRRGEDYDYWLRLSRITPIHKLSAVLALYRIHIQSITHKPHASNFPCIVIEKALTRWGPVGPDGTLTSLGAIRHVLAQHWFNFGYLHLMHGDARLAFRAFLRAGRLRPMNLKSWLNALRSLVKAVFVISRSQMTDST